MRCDPSNLGDSPEVRYETRIAPSRACHDGSTSNAVLFESAFVVSTAGGILGAAGLEHALTAATAKTQNAPARSAPCRSQSPAVAIPVTKCVSRVQPISRSADRQGTAQGVLRSCSGAPPRSRFWRCVKSDRLTILIAGANRTHASPTRAPETPGLRPSISNVITREELQRLDARTRYQAIQQLRPRWLQVVGGPRSFSIETAVVVFQDNMQLGTQDVLKQMGVEGIYTIRYMDGTTAKASLPGLGDRHLQGAILISMHPPNEPDKR